MSGMFSTPEFKTPPGPERIEDVRTVSETADDQKRAIKRHLLMTDSRRQSFVAGLQNALKRRLGE